MSPTPGTPAAVTLPVPSSSPVTPESQIIQGAPGSGIVVTGITNPAAANGFYDGVRISGKMVYVQPSLAYRIKEAFELDWELKSIGGNVLIAALNGSSGTPIVDLDWLMEDGFSGDIAVGDVSDTPRSGPVSLTL
jgi:hypothetical protein